MWKYHTNPVWIYSQNYSQNCHWGNNGRLGLLLKLDLGGGGKGFFPSFFCETRRPRVPEHAAAMDGQPSFVCRMYEEKYPEVDEVVMVQVRAIRPEAHPRGNGGGIRTFLPCRGKIKKNRKLTQSC